MKIKYFLILNTAISIYASDPPLIPSDYRDDEPPRAPLTRQPNFYGDQPANLDFQAWRAAIRAPKTTKTRTVDPTMVRLEIDGDQEDRVQ